MSEMNIQTWYISVQRILELLKGRLTGQIRSFLMNPEGRDAKMMLANCIGPTLIPFLKEQKVPTLHELAFGKGLKTGDVFTFQGSFRSKGLAFTNKSPLVCLRANVDELFLGKQLVVQFSKKNLITDTAYSVLMGKPNVFTFCSVVEIDDVEIRVVPYIIGSLVRTFEKGISVNFFSGMEVASRDLDQFNSVNFAWSPSRSQFEKLKNISEDTIKTLFHKILNDWHPAKDWGGEENDIFTGNLLLKGERKSAAFLLKGPAKFHEMKLSDCGKNADQIDDCLNLQHTYILFNIAIKFHRLSEELWRRSRSRVIHQR